MNRHASQRDMGLAILTSDSDILTIAREISALVREHSLDAVVVGGVAVVLHGHVRTTLDVDVYTADSRGLHDVLVAGGFTWDAERREFNKGGVPVHLVTPSQIPDPPRAHEDIDDIRTVSLPDLISIKLRSGTADVLRSQDLADAIGLIRHHNLTNAFTPQVASDVRGEFRKLVREIERRG